MKKKAKTLSCLFFVCLVGFFCFVLFCFVLLFCPLQTMVWFFDSQLCLPLLLGMHWCLTLAVLTLYSKYVVHARFHIHSLSNCKYVSTAGVILGLKLLFQILPSVFSDAPHCCKEIKCVFILGLIFFAPEGDFESCCILPIFLIWEVICKTRDEKDPPEWEG